MRNCWIVRDPGSYAAAGRRFKCQSFSCSFSCRKRAASPSEGTTPVGRDRYHMIPVQSVRELLIVVSVRQPQVIAHLVAKELIIRIRSTMRRCRRSGRHHPRPCPYPGRHAGRDNGWPLPDISVYHPFFHGRVLKRRSIISSTDTPSNRCARWEAAPGTHTKL